MVTPLLPKSIVESVVAEIDAYNVDGAVFVAPTRNGYVAIPAARVRAGEFAPDGVSITNAGWWTAQRLLRSYIPPTISNRTEKLAAFSMLDARNYQNFYYGLGQCKMIYPAIADELAEKFAAGNAALETQLNRLFASQPPYAHLLKKRYLCGETRVADVLDTLRLPEPPPAPRQNIVRADRVRLRERENEFVATLTALMGEAEISSEELTDLVQQRGVRYSFSFLDLVLKGGTFARKPIPETITQIWEGWNAAHPEKPVSPALVEQLTEAMVAVAAARPPARPRGAR